MHMAFQHPMMCMHVEPHACMYVGSPTHSCSLSVDGHEASWTVCTAGMLHGLFEEIPATGALAPLLATCIGAGGVAAASRISARGEPSRAITVIIAFSSDAFAEGLAIAAARESSVCRYIMH